MNRTIKIRLLLLFILLQPMLAMAQDGSSAFNFLRLPYSSHAAALGGNNISLPDDDITLALHNPALLANVSDRTLNLTYMTYMSDSKVAGAAFNKVFTERSVGAIAARYVDYGSFDGYTEDNISTGTFSVKDIELSAIYSHLLGDSWSGGVSAKFIYSKYEDYNSIALGVDLGINYYNEENELSASLAVRNLGGQITSFDDKHESMPLDVALGITKRMAHAPIRLSITLNNLHRWSNDYFYSADGKKDDFGELLLKHATFGADLLLGANFYASIGYNYRIADELSTSGSKWNGLSAGAGFTLKRLKLGASYSKLHISSASLLFNVSYTL
ncbi:MAG: type IX secretion system protein PorQ [Bacteroidaceae bacterium]|nr:type IX secretion system protein PorQ [Bacteroidaceae bacterium]